MAFHIQKPAAIGSGTVYYIGGNKWSDDYSQRQSFGTNAAARAVTEASSTVITGTRVGAGFVGATIVSD